MNNIDKTWLELWFINQKEYSKISLQKAKDIAKANYTKEVVNSIFDPADHCFCSVRLRIKYKNNFQKYYNQ